MVNVRCVVGPICVNRVVVKIKTRHEMAVEREELDILTRRELGPTLHDTSVRGVDRHAMSRRRFIDVCEMTRRADGERDIVGSTEGRGREGLIAACAQLE